MSYLDQHFIELIYIQNLRYKGVFLCLGKQLVIGTNLSKFIGDVLFLSLCLTFDNLSRNDYISNNDTEH